VIESPDISWIGVLPELVMALGAALILLIDVQWKPLPRVLCQVAGAVLALAGVAALIQGIWLDGLGPDEQTAANLTPFGGMLIIDKYGVFAHVVLVVVALCGLGAGWRFFESLGRRSAEGLALLVLSASGFALMAATPHLVMMFLGLEIGSISLYVLAGFTRTETASEEAAIKYFLLGSFASAIFIYGVALLFAGTGSLNLLEQRVFLGSNIVLRPAVLLAGLALTIIGLAFKITAAPFHRAPRPGWSASWRPPPKSEGSRR
jgi:NADH-quinone oxidoreductase subunit N